ncbi:conserved protein of unknown function [Burkholderia multivorans]
MLVATRPYTNHAADIDDLCGRLFDRWCKRRSVIPLAHLMRGWPLAMRSSGTLRQLSGALQNLIDWHAESLDGVDLRLIRAVIVLAGEAAQ